MEIRMSEDNSERCKTMLNSNKQQMSKSDCELTDKSNQKNDVQNHLSSSCPEITQGRKLGPFSLKKRKGFPLTKSRESTLTSDSANKKGIKSQLQYKKNLFVPIAGSFDSDESDHIVEQRFITKRGFLHIHYVNMPGLKKKVLKDMFHTIMDAKWRYFMLLFTLSFLVSWIVFAAIWYIIVVARKENCIDQVYSFTTAFLFSLETQVTIGYGGRAVTAECPEGVIILLVQTIIGTFINCALLGVLFAKLARPKNRGKTIVFSKSAVITLRDGRYCLIFRYVDLRERKLLDSNMRLVLIRPRLTEEGEYIPLDMADMSITIDYNQVEYTLRLFPVYPVNIIHIINEDSPLYKMSKANLENAEFELIAILEGTVPGTGNTTQAITSFKPREILWGHRYKPVFVGMRRGQTTNTIDLSTLNNTYAEGTTPKYSSKEHDSRKSSKSECSKNEKNEEKASSSSSNRQASVDEKNSISSRSLEDGDHTILPITENLSIPLLPDQADSSRTSIISYNSDIDLSIDCGQLIQSKESIA